MYLQIRRWSIFPYMDRAAAALIARITGDSKRTWKSKREVVIANAACLDGGRCLCVVLLLAPAVALARTVALTLPIAQPVLDGFLLDVSETPRFVVGTRGGGFRGGRFRGEGSRA